MYGTKKIFFICKIILRYLIWFCFSINDLITTQNFSTNLICYLYLILATKKNCPTKRSTVLLTYTAWQCNFISPSRFRKRAILKSICFFRNRAVEITDPCGTPAFVTTYTELSIKLFRARSVVPLKRRFVSKNKPQSIGFCEVRNVVMYRW